MFNYMVYKYQLWLWYITIFKIEIQKTGSQIIEKSLGIRKPKGPNRIAKIDKGHLCLRENLSFNDNNYIIYNDLGTVNLNNKYI